MSKCAARRIVPPARVNACASVRMCVYTYMHTRTHAVREAHVVCVHVRVPMRVCVCERARVHDVQYTQTDRQTDSQPDRQTHTHTRGLIDAARLDADVTVFDNVNAPDRVRATQSAVSV